MTETELVWLVPFRLAALFLFTIFYVLGGREGKWKRRWLGSLTFVGMCLGLSLYVGSYQLLDLVGYGVLVLGLNLGYGGDTFWEKLRRRLIYGVTLGTAGLLISLTHGVLPMGILQFVLAVSTSLVMGILNPVEAVNEEAMIALASTAFIPFML